MALVEWHQKSAGELQLIILNTTEMVITLCLFNTTSIATSTGTSTGTSTTTSSGTKTTTSSGTSTGTKLQPVPQPALKPKLQPVPQPALKLQPVLEPGEKGSGTCAAHLASGVWPCGGEQHAGLGLHQPFWITIYDSIYITHGLVTYLVLNVDVFFRYFP